MHCSKNCRYSINSTASDNNDAGIVSPSAFAVVSAIVLRQKWSRGQVEARLGNMPPLVQPELMRNGRFVEVMPEWRFPTQDLSRRGREGCLLRMKPLPGPIGSRLRSQKKMSVSFCRASRWSSRLHSAHGLCGGFGGGVG